MENPERILIEPVEIIPLDKAQFCENCQCITRQTNHHCGGCGSESVVPLKKWLGERIGPQSESEEKISERAKQICEILMTHGISGAKRST